MPVLDTNVLIDLGNPRRSGHADAVALVRDAMARGEAICTTRLNVAELRVGVERAADRASEERRVQRALAPLVILEFDAQSAEHFGRIQGYLLDLGRPIGDMDALIGSVCLTTGQRLITRNPKHFADIPSLIVDGY